MELRITIKCDNAAFHEDDREDVPEDKVTGAMRAECARILKKLAGDLGSDSSECDADEEEKFLYDVNGNKVGRVEFVP